MSVFRDSTWLNTFMILENAASQLGWNYKLKLFLLLGSFVMNPPPRLSVRGIGGGMKSGNSHFDSVCIKSTGLTFRPRF